MFSDPHRSLPSLLTLPDLAAASWTDCGCFTFLLDMGIRTSYFKTTFKTAFFCIPGERKMAVPQDVTFKPDIRPSVDIL